MSFSKWLRIYYHKMIESIAFYPALIAVGFLVLSWGMLIFDFSDYGKEIKSNLSWLSLKDASTARTIISTVAGAIISLTVFSFSMVMIVLNQAASQMSNRVLNSMIENRFQQVILGIYIGTIVYALFLLSTIRDISSGIYVPAFSIYLLLLLTVIDIFLFIYFLDYVTQTVKYETVIDRVRKQTFKTMEADFKEIKQEENPWQNRNSVQILAQKSDYFQGFNHKKLLELADQHQFKISFLFPQGQFILKGTPCMKVYSDEVIDSEITKEIADCADFFTGQPIDRNAEYGFRQLAEIALKALSPGINDPGTAVLSMHALFALFEFKMYNQLPQFIFTAEGDQVIQIPSADFATLFEQCLQPIWNYGKDDDYIQTTFLNMLEQLKIQDHQNKYVNLLDSWTIKVQNRRDQISN
ncbi:DUF2254 domain-containing protein [Kaistella antarctica]|uniref:Predicted membrane protein (DUF2254) n=1 Tax=Kaistella antarctica TaxID=266748 RepID=A0A448NQ42_9FLAO|nr:DUF2254 domain-containing protein [Kaistella antarctica]SEW04502.1 Uncharacterized membrane protein [Kaistella antarctica]VEH98630.1 Predicted membrane protein (DUF2254) [Kaistella antarctica]